MGQVINDLAANNGEVKETKYTNEGVEIIAIMKPGFVKAFKARITELTKGEAIVNKKREIFN